MTFDKEEFKNVSNYPASWQLTVKECEDMYEACREGLNTMDGDTAPVQVTVRQLLLLLRKQMED